MTRTAFMSLALGFAALGVSSAPALAQSRNTLSEAQTPTAPADTAPRPGAVAQPDGTNAPGAAIVVLDSQGRIATIDVSNLAVTVIGRVNVPLTDIAFNPKNHRLYGISYNALYEVPFSTLQAKLVARLGSNDANALVFDSAGTAYFAGYQTNRLFKVDVTTGHVTALGLTGQYYSAGDLTYFDGQLVMSAAFRTKNPGNRTANYIVTLNPANGAIIGTPALMDIHQIYGLASTGSHELYGLAGIGITNRPGLYRLFPGASSPAKRDRLMQDLTGSGLSLIVGTAYNGNFQP